MAAKQKPKQIITIDIKALITAAKLDGRQTNETIAAWIIIVSPYWRTKGYGEIMKAMNEK